MTSERELRVLAINSAIALPIGKSQTAKNVVKEAKIIYDFLTLGKKGDK